MNVARPTLQSALAFAASAHAAVGGARKGTRGFPYVSHPIRVAETLARFNLDEDVVVAGFLHDTVEDTNVTIEEINANFGPRVASLVAGASEPDKSLEWKVRKQHTIDALECEQDMELLALVGADKLDNVRSITDSLRHLGSTATWALFKAGEDEQRWYYCAVANILVSKAPESPLFTTLHRETNVLFGEGVARKR